MPDCGDSSCRYAEKKTGMRTNGGCKCDECYHCGAHIRPNSPQWHRQWCKMQAWIPPHHRGKMTVRDPVPTVTIQPLRPLLVMPMVHVTELEDDKSNTD